MIRNEITILELLYGQIKQKKDNLDKFQFKLKNLNHLGQTKQNELNSFSVDGLNQPHIDIITSDEKRMDKLFKETTEFINSLNFDGRVNLEQDNKRKFPITNTDESSDTKRRKLV
jgi:hypothetical protein